MTLDELRINASTCELCNLCKGRKLPIFDKGNSLAKIMLCGMVPAEEENKIGLPFVGRAGKLLDQILEDASLTLSDVYITNLVKCFLAAGKSLNQEWIDACLSYLLIQIDIIQPMVIITLGKDATIALLGLEQKLTMGKIKQTQIYSYGEIIKVIPTYHPSYLLRGGGKGHKDYNKVVEDFKKSKLIRG